MAKFFRCAVCLDTHPPAGWWEFMTNAMEESERPDDYEETTESLETY